MVSIGPNFVPPTKMNLPKANGENGGEADNTGVAKTGGTVANNLQAPTFQVNNDTLLANRGITVNKPSEPEASPTNSFIFDNWEEFIKHQKNVGFEKGDVVSVVVGKDKKGNEIFVIFEIGKNGSAKPLGNDFNYDNLDDFIKALKADAFKDGDSITVHHGDACYSYRMDGEDLVLVSYRDEKGVYQFV